MDLSEAAAKPPPPPPCKFVTDFDARTNWPRCKDAINNVFAQADCDSCWAVSVASAYTDRYCIQRALKNLNTSSTDPHFRFSALDIMSCTYPLQDGCKAGGFPVDAWKFIQKKGVVTGTDYYQNNGCRPYPYEPNKKASFKTRCSEGLLKKPKCTNSKWPTPYEKDKHYASSHTRWSGPKVKISDIQAEIKRNGPINANFFLSSDLLQRGRTDEPYIGNIKCTLFKPSNHVLEIVGWGRKICGKNVVPYWICKNSFGASWGNGGFFNVRMGYNDNCLENDGINFGLPIL
uniref:Peptidase C1A papain C-terminal domain-containing protein n=1 Tax=Meloidogyne javanica TaxID=6303 RepID=A0A915MYP5_MELJA